MKLGGKCTYHSFDGLSHVGELQFRELCRHREMHDFLLVLGRFVEDQGEVVIQALQ